MTFDPSADISLTAMSLGHLPGVEPAVQGMESEEREAALAVLEKQLTCPICLEIFNKPVVILPCQHNLCRKCANELYQARTTMMVNSGRFRCPSCRYDVVLDRHGVYGLQRNLLVENIIDIYKEEVSSPKSAPTPVSPILAAPGATCSDHAGEKVNIFCVTCQVATCSLCKVFGAHQTCQVAPLSDVHQQRKDELSKEVDALRSIGTRVRASVSQLEESCGTVQDNCSVQKQMVCDRFERMFSILEEKRQVMLLRISAEEEEKTGLTRASIRRHGDRATANARLLDQVRTSMEESDQAEFVQNSAQLIARVLAAADDCQAQTPEPVVQNMSRYRFNFGPQEQALRGLDFDKDEEDGPEEDEAAPEEPTPSEAEATTRPDSSADGPGDVPEAEAAEVPPPEPASDPVCPRLQMDCEETLDEDNGSGPEDVSAEAEGQTKGGKVMSDGEDVCAAKTRSDEEQGMSTQQAVVLLFYLLAFLLILQRFWAYIGFFICT